CARGRYDGYFPYW
nr:immunoglobulin heavy chain junction region [Mus musculus]MBK4195206.1 immunoglobulin heavy chain junction region [Mus musculus]